jgi:hypothetical protein
VPIYFVTRPIHAVIRSAICLLFLSSLEMMSTFHWLVVFVKSRRT